uniref:Uncharacterized protein n=1 Tax=Siphoviridae sp. ctL0q1 TaxID=2825449 RepID=A0A8S5PKH4_9CAUD|nr:MAG TPA: hypothetical protein [Siphoviridae sp. ctL0q1]
MSMSFIHCLFITIFGVLLCILYAYCITYHHKDIVRTCVLSFYVLAFRLCYFRKYYIGKENKKDTLNRKFGSKNAQDVRVIKNAPKGFVFSYGTFCRQEKMNFGIFGGFYGYEGC